MRDVTPVEENPKITKQEANKMERNNKRLLDLVKTPGNDRCGDCSCPGVYIFINIPRLFLQSFKEIFDVFPCEFYVQKCDSSKSCPSCLCESDFTELPWLIHEK